jgi:hemerythrin
MEHGKRNDVKNSVKDVTINAILDVGSDAIADIAKETFTGMLKEILVDAGASLIPGVYGAISGYKRARFERNIQKFANELYSKIEEIRVNLESKTKEQKDKIDQLFGYVMDYVIDEQQEEKIKLMVNGFVNITEHDQITEDFVLTYYDVLKELRMVDISVLRLMYASRYWINDAVGETYRDVMERHGLSYEQYESVRRNLHRIGLLTSVTDLSINDDLEQIYKTFKELYAYLDKLTNLRYKGSLPKLKEPKLKSKDSLQISRFGRDFVEFFLNLELRQ